MSPLGLLRDLLGLAGIGLASYGAWLVYPPAGFIVAGATLFVVAIVSAILAAPRPAGAKKPESGR